MIIRLFGKKLLQTYNHLYYKMNYESMIPLRKNRLIPFELNDSNMNLINASSALRKMIHEQPEYVSGYGFRDSFGNVIGHLFLMRKGGQEVLYKIRTIDAYLFAVRVFDGYKGNGYAGEMITWLADTLYEAGVKELYLTVKKDNHSAIRVYEKLGFKVIGKRFFVRLIKCNIPYLSL